jgi:phenylalanine ammonia-lyase
MLKPFINGILFIATDNPLIDPDTGVVHHGGNFQAMAVTTALEPMRLALFHVGKILFAQSTELQNPTMNNGLGGNLAATDPSLNFFGKGIDIAMAAYVGELAYLATPVSTGVQSAEMHNQAVNSLAFVNARYTIQAVDVVQLIIASYLLLLCQAVDLRALQSNLEKDLRIRVAELVAEHFGGSLQSSPIADAVWGSYDTSANMDARPRAEKAARASTQPIVDALLASSPELLSHLPAFQTALAAAVFNSNHNLVQAYLSDSLVPGAPGYLPASGFLGHTRAVYEYIRKDLRVGMHGRENYTLFDGGLSHGAWEDVRPSEARGRTIGGDISVIYEAIRDGRMKDVLVGMFETA